VVKPAQIKAFSSVSPDKTVAEALNPVDSCPPGANDYASAFGENSMPQVSQTTEQIKSYGRQITKSQPEKVLAETAKS
jgi:hypothetical protein